jgi:hypothetical protein
MDLAHPATLLLPVGIAALVGWRVYSRVKRLVGRQRLSKVRPWFTIVIFPTVVALLLVGSLGHPEAGLGLAGGALLGCLLGWYGLRVTKFEHSPEGLFYTPNAHLGIALSLLFVGRIAYRAAQFYFLPGSLPAGSSSFAPSPLTLLIFGTLAGYYVAYAIGLLRWRRRVTRVN